MKLSVKTVTGKVYSVEAEPTSTIRELKVKIDESGASIPPQEQKLVFNGRITKDDNTLESYGIEDGCSIHLVRSAQRQQPRATEPTTQQPTPSAVPTASTTQQQQPTAQPQQFGGLGTNAGPYGDLGALLGGLGAPGAGGGFGGGFGDVPGMPNMQQFQQLMNQPALRQIIDQMAQNPEFMRTMMQSNPMAQQMMAANPQMRWQMEMMMNNPEMLRMSMN
ncbi:MAG: putative ubiquitin family protein, partial [Streblomastix strix]